MRFFWKFWCWLFGHKPDAFDYINFMTRAEMAHYYKSGRWTCLRCGHINQWKRMVGRWRRLAGAIGDVATVLYPNSHMEMTDMRIMDRRVDVDIVVLPENPVGYITLRFEQSKKDQDDC